MMSRPAAILLFTVCSTLADTEPNLQIVGEGMSRTPIGGVVKIGDTLRCYKNKNELIHVKWFMIDDETGDETLIVSDEDPMAIEAERDDVTYRCKIDDGNFADFRVGVGDHENERNLLPFRVSKFDKSYTVVEDEDLKVECKVFNRTLEIDVNQDIVIKWYAYNVTNDEKSYVSAIGNCSESLQGSLNWAEVKVEGTPNSEPHIRLIDHNGLGAAILKIEDADRVSDRRAFKCVAYLKTNRSSCLETAFFVRVRDRYAALWPFVGIVAEVIVVCLIICICEKRKSMAGSKADDMDDDDEDMNGKASAGNSSVRQRVKN